MLEDRLYSQQELDELDYLFSRGKCAPTKKQQEQQFIQHIKYEIESDLKGIAVQDEYIADFEREIKNLNYLCNSNASWQYLELKDKIKMRQRIKMKLQDNINKLRTKYPHIKI